MRLTPLLLLVGLVAHLACAHRPHSLRFEDDDVQGPARSIKQGFTYTGTSIIYLQIH
jgi:hypothetical protein